MFALRQLRSIGRNQQRQMRELRRLGTRRLKDQNVLERIRQVVLSANNMADIQVDIVGAGSHMIGRHPAASQQREILDIGRSFRLRSIHRVVENNFRASLPRHPESQHKRLARRRPPIAFLLRHLSHPGVK